MGAETLGPVLALGATISALMAAAGVAVSLRLLRAALSDDGDARTHGDAVEQIVTRSHVWGARILVLVLLVQFVGSAPAIVWPLPTLPGPWPRDLVISAIVARCSRFLVAALLLGWGLSASRYRRRAIAESRRQSARRGKPTW